MLKRPDIQVARTVAVLAVLGFHIGVPGFFNGFLGVDAFFVISGFLMGMLYRDVKPLFFYRRRLMRLYPSLIATLLLFILLGVLVLQPFELNQLAAQAISGILGISNIAYWSQDSYFQPNRFRPFLNLWSLGVEIQFYLLFPFLLFLKRKIRLILPAIAVLSLLLNFLILQISPKTSFFLLPTRLWEFLVGTIIATSGSLGLRKKSKDWLLVAAVVFLALGFLIPINSSSTNWTTGHPGLNSLLVVIATALILKIGVAERRFKSFIGKAGVRIGDFSYEIYLIHFPLLAFINYQAFTGTITELSSLGLAGLAIAAIILLSYAVFKVNKVKILRSISTVSMISVALLFFLSAIPVSKLALAGSSEISRVTSFAISDRSQYRCGKVFRVLNPTTELCLISKNYDSKKDNLLLFGNSHADMIKDEVVIAAENRANVYFWVQNSPFQLQIQEILNVLSKFKINKVLIHSSTANPEPNQLVQLIEKGANLEFLMLGSIPTYSENVPKIVHDNVIDEGLSFSKLDISRYLVPESLAGDKHYESVNGSNFEYISTLEEMCRDSSCRWHDSKNNLYYFDTDHLTLTGAKAIRVPISIAVDKLLSK
jgi:peptidoglycan/LPS O-acetylase OafA/YrhL